jgi:hypothetical protein
MSSGVGFSGRFLRLSGADMRGLWRGKSLPQRRKGRGEEQFSSKETAGNEIPDSSSS